MFRCISLNQRCKIQYTPILPHICLFVISASQNENESWDANLQYFPSSLDLLENSASMSLTLACFTLVWMVLKYL